MRGCQPGTAGGGRTRREADAGDAIAGRIPGAGSAIWNENRKFQEE